MLEIKDQSTVFSIVPFLIEEFKPGIYPGTFKIAACMDDRIPERLLIPGPPIHMMQIGGQEKPIAIPTATYEIGRSIVQDFLNSQLWSTPDAHPGITFVQGDVSVSEFISRFADEYNRIRHIQNEWFKVLVRETDSDWSKYNQNPRVVSFPAKFAAQKLGLDKPWMRDDMITATFVSCPGCAIKLNPDVAVCSNCRCVVNVAKYKELQFA